MNFTQAANSLHGTQNTATIGKVKGATTNGNIGAGMVSTNYT